MDEFYTLGLINTLSAWTEETNKMKLVEWNGKFPVSLLNTKELILNKDDLIKAIRSLACKTGLSYDKLAVCGLIILNPLQEEKLEFDMYSYIYENYGDLDMSADEDEIDRINALVSEWMNKHVEKPHTVKNEMISPESILADLKITKEEIEGEGYKS